jgi:hypothetical protein
MWCLTGAKFIALGVVHASRSGPPTPPRLDQPMLFGFLWTLLTLLFFAHRRQARRFMLGFAISLAGLCIYGAMQAMWSLATVTALWCAATFAQWRSSAPEIKLSVANAHHRKTRTTAFRCDESRMSRMFGRSR